MQCHAVDKHVIGPSFQSIKAVYKRMKSAGRKLIDVMRMGSDQPGTPLGRSQDARGQRAAADQRPGSEAVGTLDPVLITRKASFESSRLGVARRATGQLHFFSFRVGPSTAGAVVRNRSILRAANRKLLESIPDVEYERRYRISKRWWLEMKPDLMAVLLTTKPAKNQHTK